MQTLVIMGQKGGTGKTTMAISLAVAAILRGMTVALIDMDPQTTAENWGDRRGEFVGVDQKLFVSSCLEGRLGKTLDTARDNGFDLAIVDTGGKLESVAITASRQADRVLVPINAQIFEVETLKAVKKLLVAAGSPRTDVVITKAHPSTRDPVGEIQEIINQYGFTLAPVALKQRRVYARAPDDGHGPQEIERDGKAAGELNALLDFVLDKKEKKANKKDRAA